ncbi:YdbL family protein [Shewanella sp.]|uniref:YdbL family protein n=1 Tax=Shewanella sp. TaxID=50422 RepID=UPI003567FAE7
MKRLMLITAAALLSFNAFAMDLQEAKSQGYLGEQQNGYLGLVTDNAEARAVMEEVNAKRRAHYEKIAAKNKIATADVAKMAAEKAMKAADKGHFIQDESGKWIKK